MKFKRTAIAMALAVLVQAFALAEDSGVIKIRVADSDYPPQYYRNAKGEWAGLDVELARAFVLEAGFVPEFIPRPWSRALTEMKEGTLHMMLNLSKTDERSDFMYWIGPERYEDMVLVVKAGNAKLPITNLDDLIAFATKSGKKIGIQQDAYYGEEFRKRSMDKAFITMFDVVTAGETNARMLQSDRIAGYIDGKVTVLYNIRLKPDFAGLAMHPFTLNSEPVYFGISKKGISVKALRKLEEAYKRLASSGKLEEIWKKYW